MASACPLPFEIQNIRDQVHLKPRCLAAFGWSGGSGHRNDKGLCGNDHLLIWTTRCRLCIYWKSALFKFSRL